MVQTFKGLLILFLPISLLSCLALWSKLRWSQYDASSSKVDSKKYCRYLHSYIALLAITTKTVTRWIWRQRNTVAPPKATLPCIAYTISDTTELPLAMTDIYSIIGNRKWGVELKVVTFYFLFFAVSSQQPRRQKGDVCPLDVRNCLLGRQRFFKGRTNFFWRQYIIFVRCNDYRVDVSRPPFVSAVLNSNGVLSFFWVWCR